MVHGAFDDGLCQRFSSHLKDMILELEDHTIVLARLNAELIDIRGRLRRHSAQRSQELQAYGKKRFQKEECMREVEELKYDIKAEIKKSSGVKGWLCGNVEDVNAISIVNQQLEDLGKIFLGFFVEEDPALTDAAFDRGVEMNIISMWGLAGLTSNGANVCFITEELKSKLGEIRASRAREHCKDVSPEEQEEESKALNYFITNFEKSGNLKGFLCVDILDVEVLRGIRKEFSDHLCCCLDPSHPNSKRVRKKALEEFLECAEIVVEGDENDEDDQGEEVQSISMPNWFYFDDTYHHKKDRA